jgi:hypothetical protein
MALFLVLLRNYLFIIIDARLIIDIGDLQRIGKNIKN